MTIDTLIQLSYKTGYSAAIGATDTEQHRTAVANRDKLRNKLVNAMVKTDNDKRYYAFVVLPSGRTIAYYNSDRNLLVENVLLYLNSNYNFGLRNLRDLQDRAYDLWLVVDFFKESDEGRLLHIS